MTQHLYIEGSIIPVEAERAKALVETGEWYLCPSNAHNLSEMYNADEVVIYHRDHSFRISRKKEEAKA